MCGLFCALLLPPFFSFRGNAHEMPNPREIAVAIALVIAVCHCCCCYCCWCCCWCCCFPLFSLLLGPVAVAALRLPRYYPDRYKFWPFGDPFIEKRKLEERRKKKAGKPTWYNQF